MLSVATGEAAPATPATTEGTEIGRALAAITPAMRGQRWDDAVAACRRMVELADRMPAGESAYYRRKAEYNAACALARQGRADEAIAALGRALADRYWDLERIPADSDLATLRDRGDLAALLKAAEAARAAALASDDDPVARADALEPRWRPAYAAARYDEALSIALEELRLRERSLPENHPSRIEAHSRAGIALLQLARYEEARAHLQRTLDGWRHVTGSESAPASQALNNLQAVIVRLGRYEEAIPLARETVAIAERAFGKDAPEVADVLVNLAGLLKTVREEDEALLLLDRVVRIREPVPGKDGLGLGDALIARGDALARAGRVSAARADVARGLAIRRRALPAGHPAIAEAVMRLADIDFEAEGMDVARASFDEALHAYESAFGPAHPSVLDPLSKIATQMLAASDAAGALPLVDRALAIVTAAKGMEHPDIANLGILRGRCLLELGRLDEAESSLRGALVIQERTFGERSPVLGLVLHRLARVAVARRDLPAARATYDRILGLLSGEQEALDLGRARVAYGSALAELGRAVEGLPLAEKGLAGLVERLGPSVSEVTDARATVARCRLDSGDREGAAAALRPALEAYRRRAAHSLRGLSSRQRLLFLDNMHRVVDQAVATLADPDEALGVVLAWKGAWQRGSAAERAKGPDDAETTRLRGELEAASTQLDRALRSRSDGGSGGTKGLAALQERVEEIERALALRVPRVALEDALLEPEPAAIARRLGASGLLVETIVSGDHLHAWTLRSGVEGPVTRHVDLGPVAPIRSAVLGLRAAALAEPFDAAAMSAAQALVGALLIQPLGEDWARARTVALAADGPIADLPPALLPGRPRDDGQPSFLVEERLIVTLVSGADVLRPAPAATLSSGLVVGGVDFAQTASEPGGTERWHELPGTADEARTVRRLLAGRHPDATFVELGAQAATPRSVQDALQRCSVAHVATHAFFPPDDDAPGLRPGRAARGLTLAKGALPRPDAGSLAPTAHPWTRAGLALAADPASRDDGLLTALEVSSLDLSRLQLCVLSACGTGLGDPTRGQGVIGLGSAFLAAGTRALVLSLWSVPDEATRRLMEGFYSAEADPEDSPAAALQQAQVKILAEQRRSGALQPAAWAGWSVIGW